MNTAKQNPRTCARKSIDQGKLTTSDLEVTYHSDAGETVALCRTSLTIHPGEFVRVLGPKLIGDLKASLLWEEFGTAVVFVTHDVDESIFLLARILVMSRAPGRIEKDIANPLPRPLDQMISSEAEFLEIKCEFMEITRAESMRTF